MLEWLDTLIGFVLVMLVFSLAVTAITEVVAGWGNARGRFLRDGVAQLLVQVHPPLAYSKALEIARTVLMHPLVSREPSRLGIEHVLFWLKRRITRSGQDFLVRDQHRKDLGRARLGNVIEREKFTKLLAGLVADEEPLQLKPETREELRKIMGFVDEAEARRALKDVRAEALQLEVDQPELATHQREGISIANHMATEFVAKVSVWFDPTMERVQGRFIGHTRAITFVAAVALVTFLQLDALQIFERISLDPQLRRALVAQGVQVAAKEEARSGAGRPSTGDAVEADQRNTADTVAARPPADQRASAAYSSTVAQVVPIPTWDELRGVFQRKGAGAIASPGLVLAWILLSFGAPFWYGILNGLLKLRPSLAYAEDRQRQERSTNQTIVPGPSGAGPSVRGRGRFGEQGDAGDEGAVG